MIRGVTTGASPDVTPSSAPLPWAALLALYLGPGMLLASVYAFAAPRVADVGLPPVVALLGGTILVLVPVELAVLAVAGHRLVARSGGPRTGLVDAIRSAVGPVAPMRVWASLWLVPVVTAAAILLPGVVAWVEPWVRTHVFGWLPPWYGTYGLDAHTLAAYTPGVRAGIVGLWVTAAVLIGPVVEEWYFRGFLLPRTAGGGRAAPPLNALLFSAYHQWQPSAMLTVACFALPLAYAVWRRRALGAVITAHCLINGLAAVTLFGGLAAR